MTSKREHPPAKSSKWGDLLVRTISAVVIIGTEVLLMCIGKYPLFAELLIIEFLGFRELLHLSIEPEKEKPIGFRIKVFPYILLFAMTYLISGKTILHYFIADTFIARFHYIAVFLIVMLALFLFVTGLTPENDQYAYKRFTYAFCGAFIIGIPCNLYTKFADTSLFWFSIPIFCVVANDTAAYFCGRLFGRHQLIKLSPNKTVEGFVGALILTPLVFIGATYIAAQFPYIYCRHSKPFDFNVQCVTPKEFVPTTYEIFDKKFTILPAYIHATVIALFASLVSPFGGFFASGFKRSLGIKDFSHLIPGHGGILDRVDCQLVNCIFAYLYYITFVQ